MQYAYMNFSNNKNRAALGWFPPLATVLRAQESSQLRNYRRYIRLMHRLIPTLAHMQSTKIATAYVNPNDILVGYLCIFSSAEGEMGTVSCSPSP